MERVGKRDYRFDDCVEKKGETERNQHLINYYTHNLLQTHNANTNKETKIYKLEDETICFLFLFLSYFGCVNVLKKCVRV